MLRNLKRVTLITGGPSCSGRFSLGGGGEGRIEDAWWLGQRAVVDQKRMRLVATTEDARWPKQKVPGAR